MSYLIDTNIIIFFFKDKHGIDRKIEKVGIENCYISELTVAELKYGAAYSKNPEKHFQEIEDLLTYMPVIPISSSIDFFSNEKARLRKLGTLIDDFDLLIGSTAIINDFILVTNNTKHFKRLEGIKLEDWTKK
ncbi:MAG: type II toxin-antitoxin system VapC family toxin [Bacteroidota bacterium]